MLTLHFSHKQAADAKDKHVELFQRQRASIYSPQRMSQIYKLI